MEALNLRQLIHDAFDREVMPMVQHMAKVLFLATVCISGAVGGLVAWMVAEAKYKRK